MGSEVNTWKDWEISADWINSTVCPDCGNTLIITNSVARLEGSFIYNGICHVCRKQYTINTDTESLTENPEAATQQDRIAALEARVTQLEALVQKLLTGNNPPTHPSLPPEEDGDFRKKYSYLF